MAALDGTIALEQVNAVAMFVKQDLNFNVARAFYVALTKNSRVAKPGQSLALASGQSWCEFVIAADDAHSTATAAGSSL